MASQPHGVVVTGLGVVSPIGAGVEAFWAAALAGTSGTADVTLFDTGPYLTHRAAEVRDWDLRGEPVTRGESFALAAARMALEDAGAAALDPRRTGVCFGNVLSARPAAEPAIRRGGPLAPVARAAHEAPRISRLVAREHGLLGPNVTLLTACAAGNSAVGHGMDLVAGGHADAMVVGGADELSETLFMMFNRFRALAPERVQPFDRDRRGLMISEGAGALVIESERSARARGARIHGRVAGYGNLADAHDMTAPHPGGDGVARSMRAALAMAGIEPAGVDYVCAHGTGTPANDVAEARAVREVLGAAADGVPVTSLKAMLGHSLGAAGAIEAVACLLTIRDGVIPPTMHLDVLDPACEIRVVAGQPLERPVRVALNNSFGFGGNNSCVVLTAEGVR
jgi:3-oxoacyl-(acyl-carrier-protein) synthase